MTLLKNNRRGTASLADFYAAEFLFRENSKWHTILINEVIDITKKIILDDVAFCICEELKNATTQTIYNNEIKMNNVELLVDRWHEKNGHPQRDIDLMWKNIKNFIQINGGKRRVIEYAKTEFFKRNWNYSYGGPKWGEICKRALLVLYSDRKSFREKIVLIDMLIDSCHNTGHSLDKLYYHASSKEFLDKKTNSQDLRWLIRMAQPGIREMEIFF